MFLFGLLSLWFLCRPLNPYQHRKVPLTAPSGGFGSVLGIFLVFRPSEIPLGCWIFGFMCRILNPYQHRRVPLAAPSRGVGFVM